MSAVVAQGRILAADDRPLVRQGLPSFLTGAT